MFYENETVMKLLPDYENAVLEGQIESLPAASELIEKYSGKR